MTDSLEAERRRALREGTTAYYVRDGGSSIGRIKIGHSAIPGVLVGFDVADDGTVSEHGARTLLPNDVFATPHEAAARHVRRLEEEARAAVLRLTPEAGRVESLPPARCAR